ncbi:Ubiquinone/menaquinone biosynthesis C-methylase UbiE [Pseudarcicella hirudinis]|uniref:Ubiquinone/menaquinone biosynthesis C-methylase UbiE n=1 Tax=Pseudarcicella hirudinis TaxID=1079859 RepID=A0A1I5UJ24_9BACT|nr:methyltransferase domain-containing protein [Pseudarcicella hirudinis]SFP94616.1 Ubiquinone/menaquinone biosynthesis C-methylase UbiE [Pseudarcicella hirudinis]
MPDLSYRSNEKELIDDLTLDNDALRQNLEELALINRFLGGNQVTLSGLGKALKHFQADSVIGKLKIADLGCGGGDMLIVMAKWLRKRYLSSELTGIDANDFMIRFAQKRTADFPEISYLQENVFEDSFKELSFDIITMTLFCHHFSDDLLIKLFSQLRRQASKAVIINDIHRHWFAYHSIAWITRLFLKSYLVKNDAKLSVWRAFRRSDLEKIIIASGFTKYSIQWKWAFRWEVVLYV